MRAIPISQSTQFRSYLTSAAIAVGDLVAMDYVASVNIAGTDYT